MWRIVIFGGKFMSELDYGISALLDCLDSDDHDAPAPSTPPAKRARQADPVDDTQDLASLSKGINPEHNHYIIATTDESTSCMPL